MAVIEALSMLGVPSLQTEHERVVFLLIFSVLFLIFATLTFVAQHKRIKELERGGANIGIGEGCKVNIVGGRSYASVDLKNRSTRDTRLEHVRTLLLDKELSSAPIANEERHGSANLIEPGESLHINTPMPAKPIFIVVGVRFSDPEVPGSSTRKAFYMRWAGVSEQGPHGMEALSQLAHADAREKDRIDAYLKQHGISLTAD
jgi:hypothetical protein